MKNRYNLLALIIFVGLLTACQVDPRAECQSRIFGSAAGYQNKSFVILTPKRGGSLENQQYAEYAKRAFAYKGLVPATDSRKADWSITMDYGIGTPRQEVSSRIVPIFGQTGVSSVSTYGSATPTYGGGYSYNSTSTAMPTFGVTGAVPVVNSSVVYDRILKLSAARPGSDKPEWAIDVSSSGPTSDLNEILPYMLVAATEVLTNSSGTSENLIVPLSGVQKRIFKASP